MIRLIALCCLLGLVRILPAWVLEGRIVHAESGLPIQGANLQVLESPLGTSSDARGHFRLDVEDHALLRLRVTHLGFGERTLPCRPDTPPLEIRLHPLALDAGELVYSAELREQTARHASTRVNVRRMAEVPRHRGRELTKLLETVPGVGVQRSDGATANSLSIRGSSNLLGGGVGNRVLLLVDGRPALSADTGGADWSSLPMALVERVEVVKGSASALYGSAAMGGVIHLVTQRRLPERRLSLSLGGSFEAAPVESRRFREGPHLSEDLQLTLSDSGQKLGWYASAGQRASNGHRQNSDFRGQNLLLGLRVTDPKSASRLDLGLRVGNLDRAFPHRWDNRARPLHISSQHPEWLNDRQLKRSLALDLAWRKTGQAYRLQLNAWQEGLLSESVYHDPHIRDTRSLALRSGLRAVASRRWGRSHDLSLGMDLLADRVDGRPLDIFYGEHTATTAALFAQDEWSLPSPLPAFLQGPVVTSGARLDRNQVSGRDEEWQGSPRLGLSLPGTGPLRDWVLRLTAGRAFRFPTIADLYLKSVPGNDYSFVANPHLRAERSTSLETGVHWTPLDGLSADLALFRYQYTDMIHYRDTDDVSVFEIVNLQRARIRGCELEADARLGAFRWQLSYTWVESRNEDTGLPLPYQPEHRFYARGSWSKGPWKAGVDWRRVSRTDVVRFYASDAPKGYGLVGIELARRLGDWQLSLAVENLANTAYEEMERYRLPGRVFRLGLQGGFQFVRE